MLITNLVLQRKPNKIFYEYFLVKYSRAHATLIRGIRETSETMLTVLSFPPDTDIDWVDLADDIKHEYFVIDNLRPSHGYKFRVAAANQGGNSLLEFV